jgi:hypothetical protein
MAAGFNLTVFFSQGDALLTKKGGSALEKSGQRGNICPEPMA